MKKKDDIIMEEELEEEETGHRFQVIPGGKE